MAAGALLAALLLLAGAVASSQSPLGHNDTAVVSVASSPDGAKGDDWSDSASINGGGRFIAFDSIATNLHPDSPDMVADIFHRDMRRNVTTLVSRATGARGARANDFSADPSISTDGRFVAFTTAATNLDADALDLVSDIYVRDVREEVTTLVSRASGPDGASGDDHSALPSISADGRFVAFVSAARNLHPDDAGDGTDDIYVRDLEEDVTVLVSRASGLAGEKGDDTSSHPSISSDGRFVAFHSAATNLHPDATDGTSDIFVRDLQEHTTTLVSRGDGAAGAKGDDDSFNPSISADGRFVAFSSAASNLDPLASGTHTDIFVRDLEEDATVLVSRASGPGGQSGDDGSMNPSISADGRFVAFASSARNLHPAADDDDLDIFVRDLLTQATTLASRAPGAAGAKGDGASFSPSIAGSGRFVAFTSVATNLHPDVNDGLRDVFRRELSMNRPAKLEIDRARLRDGRLSVRGSLDPAAAGERVTVTFRAAGRQVRTRHTVGAQGQFRAERNLRGPQRGARAGQVRVHYGGNEVLRATAARLRAAARAVRLRVDQAVIRGNQLVASGRVAPQGRRQVRVAVEFNYRNGVPGRIAARAPVNQAGRWQLRQNVPFAARSFGAHVSFTHPGRARLHGQRRGRDVGG